MNFWRPTDALCSSVQVSSQTHRRQKLSCSPSLPSMRCQTIWVLRPFPDTILLQLHIIWYAQACGAAAFSSRVGWLRSSGALWAEAPQVLPGLDNPHKAPCFTLPAAEHRLLSHALSAAWLCLRNPGEPWRCGRCGPQLPPHTRALLRVLLAERLKSGTAAVDAGNVRSQASSGLFVFFPCPRCFQVYPVHFPR